MDEQLDLTQERCVACEGGEAPLAPERIPKLHKLVPDWTVGEVDGHPILSRTYTFGNFVESIAFVNKVKDVAEHEGHHPDLHIQWNTVRVENWTHATGGLHRNDFILAAKIDQLAA